MHAATWLTLHAEQELPQTLHHVLCRSAVTAFIGQPVKQVVGEVTLADVRPHHAVLKVASAQMRSPRS